MSCQGGWTVDSGLDSIIVSTVNKTVELIGMRAVESFGKFSIIVCWLESYSLQNFKLRRKRQGSMI